LYPLLILIAFNPYINYTIRSYFVLRIVAMNMSAVRPEDEQPIPGIFTILTLMN